jgi:hypothetical protein
MLSNYRGTTGRLFNWTVGRGSDFPAILFPAALLFSALFFLPAIFRGKRAKKAAHVDAKTTSSSIDQQRTHSQHGGIVECCIRVGLFRV